MPGGALDPHRAFLSSYEAFQRSLSAWAQYFNMALGFSIFEASILGDAQAKYLLGGTDEHLQSLIIESEPITSSYLSSFTWTAVPAVRDMILEDELAQRSLMAAWIGFERVSISEIGREKYFETRRAAHVFNALTFLKLDLRGSDKTLDELIEVMDLFSSKYKKVL